ncbi:hypothetical protein CAPTEDRAFT_63624, partial [Capitella teleta]
GNEFLQEMSATFRDMRHSDEMVDVVLVFEETRVKCHRLVLAASCDYFRRMFQADMQERDAGEIPMKDVSSTTGLLLVEYLYSGNIQISAENAQELLAVSDRLLLTKLKKCAEEFLCEQVASTNCVSLKNLARLYGLETLIKVIHSYLHDHWKKLIDMESEIDQLTEDDLIALLTTHGSDEGSFLLLQKWVRSSQERTGRFMELLQNLELTLFSKEFVCRTIMSDELMQNAKGMKIIQEAMESLVIADRNQSLVVGDYKGNIWFCADDQQWQGIQVPFTECYNYSVTSSSDGFIVSAHTRQWRTLPPMSVGRLSHASICDQDEFILIGGCISPDAHLNSVECLNLKTLKWSQLPNLPLGQTFSNVVYVQSQLFVIGGFTSSTTVSRDVHLFDSTEREWQLRSPMPEENEGHAVPFDSKIFILGGGSKCCMQYDPCTDMW